jgi:hypothetical protein
MLHVSPADIGTPCALAFIEHTVSLFELVSSVRSVAGEHTLNQQKTLQTTLVWWGPQTWLNEVSGLPFSKPFNKEHFPMPHARDKWQEISMLATAVKMKKP